MKATNSETLYTLLVIGMRSHRQPQNGQSLPLRTVTQHCRGVGGTSVPHLERFQAPGCPFPNGSKQVKSQRGGRSGVLDRTSSPSPHGSVSANKLSGLAALGF